MTQSPQKAKTPTESECAIAMEKYIKIWGEHGFSKSGMKFALGDMFSEIQWRRFVNIQNRAISSEYSYDKELREWSPVR